MGNNFCEFCKKNFFRTQKTQRFCSSVCQGKDYNRRPEIREKHRIFMKEYRKNNEEWREKHRILQSKYKEKRKIYIKEYFSRPVVKQRMRERHKRLSKNDPNFAVADRLRRSLHHALTKYSNSGKIMSSKKYGINWEEIIESLKHFPKDIKNYEIDHIMPLCIFNLTDTREVQKAFSPENLRWLTKIENRRKGGRIESGLQMRELFYAL